MAETNPEDARMSLGDHLEELRTRLFLGLIGPVIAAVVLLFVSTEYIVPVLTAPMLEALEAAGQPAHFYTNKVGAAFGIYLRIAMIGGLIIGIPWLGYQLWKFVEPALYSHERRFIIYLMPGSAVLAITGVLFMYFVALPFTLYFLIGFTNAYARPIVAAPAAGEVQGPIATAPLILPRLVEDPEPLVEGMAWIKVPEDQARIYIHGNIRKLRLDTTALVTQQQDLGEYIKFVTWLALAFAVSFQLPLVMLGIGFIGVMNYETMRKGWRFVIMGCVVVGAILTPADLASMIALAVPLYILYEFGLQLVKFFVPKRDNSDAEPDGA